MDEDESLHRYGLHPTGTDLDEVRDLLTAQTRLEKRAQGDGDTELMKLCCVQLFCAGVLDDVLLIWRAKTASMDADGSIDIPARWIHERAPLTVLPMTITRSRPPREAR